MPVVLFAPFEKPSSAPALIRPSHQIDVWIFNLDCSSSELAALSELLSPDERTRRSRLKHSSDASRWTVARARLRQILGSYLENRPYQGEFIPNRYGKPHIKQSALAPSPNFNLSHSGQICGVAVCLSGEIGLDIETIGAPPWEVQTEVFSQREIEEIASYAGLERRLAFYRGWTRKEAVIKAMGHGLSFPMRDLDVELAQTETRLLRLQSNWDPGWTIAGLEEAGCWVGALAMKTAGTSIDVRFRNTGSRFGTEMS